MKTYKLIALSCLIGGFSQAQTLADAIKKTENERYAAAREDFKKLIAKETKAENYFYFGENYFLNDEVDSAKMMYEKGISIDPNSALNIVGIGKYHWYKGDSLRARENFKKAATLTKNKNAEVLRNTAEVFIYSPYKRLNEAIELLNLAIKYDEKNPDSYLILGDALLEKTPENGSPAIQNYNIALDKNPKSCVAIVRTAKLYQRARNYELADAKYKEAQKLDPTYAPAYRENAELNMLFNQSSKAIENWKKYLELNNSIEARYRFATSLFTGKKYCDAITELLTVQNGGFNNFYVERMLFYSYYECPGENAKEGYEKSLAASDKLFKMAPSEKIIAGDYKYKAQTLSKLGSDSLAIQQYLIGIDKDPAMAKDLYGEVAKLYSKAKKYNEVIETYNKKMGSDPFNLTAQEYYDFGKAYYFGPKNYAMADTCFRRLAERSPSYAISYFWLARAKYKFEVPAEKAKTKEAWLAKDNYKKFVDMLKPEEMANASYKSFVMEACKYLGDYYVNSPEKNKEEAKKYWGIVKTLEPADKQAAAFFASPLGR